MYDVTALGELLIDFAPACNDEGGYPVMAAKPGGAPCNYLAALARYGAKTALYAKVGADAFGKLLVQTIKDAGIETKGIIEDASVFTTLAFVTLDASGDRSFSFARKPGADTCLRFDELDLALIDSSKAFHFGTLSLTNEPSKEATQKAVEYAKNAGKLITYDPNLRVSLWESLNDAKEQMLWGLNQADIVKISDEEVEFLWGCGEKDGAELMLRDYGVKLAMVSCGARGAYMQNKLSSVFLPCPPVNCVDTTGGGDIFGGGAVSRILRTGKAPDELTHDELAEVLAFAIAAGSLSTMKSGGIPSIPEEAEVKAVAGTLLDMSEDFSEATYAKKP